MAEYIFPAQTIQPGADAVIGQNPIPDRGLWVRFPNGFRRWFWLVRARLGSTLVQLNGRLPLFSRGGCQCCQDPSIGYPVHFSGNIAIAEGGTAGTVSLALTVNGAVLPESRMDSTPAAVGDSNNINTQITADVWQGCCESITVRNISDQAVTITESVLDIEEPNLNR
jgi:hypothetical protein